MKRSLLLATACVVVAACSDSPVAPTPNPLTRAGGRTATDKPGTVNVTSSLDNGKGSFRAAIEAANTDPGISRIKFAGLRVVELETPVEFTGSQALEIDGELATLDGAALTGTQPAFLVTGGGDLSVNGLTVRNAPGAGIDVEVPASATGIRTYSLVGVAILNNKGHGVVINDQTAPDEAGDPDASPPIPPNMAGSAASVHVSVLLSRFEGNGFSVSDRDGLRINEGGDGDLLVDIRLTASTDNGADGIELDERGNGDVNFTVIASQLLRNGIFDPTDFDDGMDVDEAGPGSLIANVALTSANDNFEEGFDFNENDAGDFRVEMSAVEASRNAEEGIDFEEDDDFAGGGDLVTTLVDITANGNAAGDAGVKIREKGVGNLDATVTGVEASDNQTGGIQVREDAAGNLVAHISGATTRNNATNGIDFDENAAGNLTADVSNAVSADNTGIGVRADNAGAGVGTLVLTQVTLSGNGGGNTGGGGVTITQNP